MNGTIAKRPRKDGKPCWAFWFDAGKDEAGKRQQSTKSGFKTKGAAEEALRKAIAELEAKRDAKPVNALPTFGEFFRRWMEQHASRKCSPKTLEAYGQHGAYAIREFGQVTLDKLTPELLEMALNKIQDSGAKTGRSLATKTVRHNSFVVGAALSKAVRWKHIATNPMDDVEHPKLVKSRPTALDHLGIKQVLDRAEGTRLYPLLVTVAATGCRRGELLAALWSDLEPQSGVLTISKSLEETRAGLRVKSTKSGESRNVALPSKALEVLSRHREEQDNDRRLFGSDYRDHNLIFCRPDGEYYMPHQMSSRVTELARSAGLQRVGLHSLRHSHASQLLSSGAPITAVADRLGHANSAITLSIYSHALPADKSAAAELWNSSMADVMQTERKARPLRMFSKC